ncbi:hypothetical protein KBD49_10785 [Myxococcota bacterium]|nr:hypothetical protein [Myxococcota bacterium]
MQILMTATVDLGVSLGVDDRAFHPEEGPAPGTGVAGNRVGEFLARWPAARVPPSKEVPQGELELPLGTGLAVDLGEAGMVRAWRDGARVFSRGEGLRWLLEWVPALAPLAASFEATAARLGPLFDGVEVGPCRWRTFGIGVGVLQAWIELPDDDADLALALCKCYEYAGYRELTRAMQPLCLDLLRTFAVNDRMEQISRRFFLEKREEIDAWDRRPRPDLFDQGFHHSLILAEDSPAAGVALDQVRSYETEQPFEPVRNDCGQVHLGWAASVLWTPRGTSPSPADPEGPAVSFARLLEVANLCLSVTMSFEKHFARRMRQAVQQALSREKATLRLAELNEMRALAGAVTELTRFSSMTSSISARAVLDRWERLTALPDRQERIQRAAELLHTVQGEAIRLEDERKQQRLSTWGFVLAAFTLVSTVSDIIATVDYNHDLLPQILGRTVLLATGPLLFIWLLRRSLGPSR